MMLPELFSKELTPVNGCPIVKVWEVNSLTGKIKKDSIGYIVYARDDEDAFYDCVKTLKEAQALARSV